MATTRQEAQRLLDQARHDAWWGGVWGNMGWALDHIVQFFSGFCKTFTPSYELTLNIMLKMDKITRADYDAMLLETATNRTGQTAGTVGFMVVNGAAGVAKSGGNWIMVNVGRKTYQFGGTQALVLVDMVLKLTGIWTKP